MSPAVLYIIALVGFPFVLAIVYAFTDISTGNPELDFVGWATFRRVLADPVFREALWNTFLFAVIANVLVVVLATALAEILVRDFKGKWLVRFLVLLLLVRRYHWRQSPGCGPWTRFSPHRLGPSTTGADHGEHVLAGPARDGDDLCHRRPDVADRAVGAVIVMAGLIAIPSDITDAVAVDGAGFWRRMFQVTIPLLAPIIAVAVLFGVISTISDMSVVYVLTRGGPTNSTQVLSTWAFIKGIEGGALAQGAAVASSCAGSDRDHRNRVAAGPAS